MPSFLFSLTSEDSPAKKRKMELSSDKEDNSEDAYNPAEKSPSVVSPADDPAVKIKGTKPRYVQGH